MSKLLSRLERPHGSTKPKKRLGRGDASGHGGTSGRGHKGQKARAGGYHKLGFEGGQMPLARRLPKRGFNNIFRKEYLILNLSELSSFAAGSIVDQDYLIKTKKIRQKKDKIKILGNGELKVSLTVRAHHFSKTAKEKIEKAGGKAELIEVKAS